ncbi:ImmA/IrrE family metallo-endopeptidase [Alicyclobacillus macrosporangiidus]|uniref:IrrE N-terminal-like domain-containing protein n=1 Tax=Alicyclobacillus macrosporangiidus TaxID=392015 RepID=A0A1I7FTF2_9BACL|nr:ImmA/IrrE family metallo-endopeptidase [Alicyclobacillus macrosporangiidus]SFU39286.1 protein of unknown function [Alicyclobacillus macrosporangiidus]
MDSLMYIVEQEKIFLSFKDLSPCPRTIYGFYFFDPSEQQPHIVLDRQLKEGSPLYRSVLAEELGHHFTVPQGTLLVPYTSYSHKLILNKDERRALQWACDYLVPISEFEKALAAGITDTNDLAEHFNVTPWLIRRRLQFMREKHARMQKTSMIRNIALIFLGPAVCLTMMSDVLQVNPLSLLG